MSDDKQSSTISNSTSPLKRTLIIGDIHGCFDELQDLLNQWKPTDLDTIISVGDLVCKGPESLKVLEWAMNAKNLICIQGNHESRLLKYWRLDRLSEEKPYDAAFYRELGSSYESCMEFLSSWPLFLDHPDFVVVHAGLDIRKGWLEQQDTADLLNLRLLKDTNRPWYTEYKSEKPIVFGHWVHRSPVLYRSAFGLDTGCVYGGVLSGLSLPDWKIVSVPARRAYQEKRNWAVQVADL